MTGLVLELDELDSADKIQPNQVPSGLDRISFKAEEHIKTISGVSPTTSTGFAREDVSAKAVQQNKSSGSTNTVKMMDNLNRTDHLLARNVLDMVQEYYTEERLVHITTDRLTRATEQHEGQPADSGRGHRQRPDPGRVRRDLTTQPERDTFEDSQFDQAVSLRNDVGIPIPDRFIIQSSRLRDKAQIVQALEGDQESPEAQMQKQLQQRAMIADVGIKEADAQSKGADAKLKVAKTQREMAEAQNAQAGGPEAELALKKQEMEMELAMKREEMQQEMELERAKMAQELQLAREKHAQDMSLKQQQVQSDIETKQAMALHAAANQPQKEPDGDNKK
jgi:hypothetical protein